MALPVTLTPDAPIVILTGAGISKESGLDTFRDADGIWSKVSIEEVATPEAFARDPGKVQGFYNVRRQSLLNPTVQPNAAHVALAHLETAWPGDVLLVTQNIDDLHERAGSTNMIHMHGEMLKALCNHCDAVSPWRGDLSDATPCPDCGATGGMRPDVVWFGEMPYEMERIFAALARCALFISIGTSGNVYPAAGFVQEARQVAGAHTVELNLEPSSGVTAFAEARHGPATEVVPAYVKELLALAG